jgi:hypothetical protein
MNALKANTSKIAALNDRFRMSLGIPAFSGGIPGNVVMTAGIAALPPDDVTAILGRVRTFSDFNEDNDPRGEHDFGAFEHAGQRVFFKFDYYAPDMMHGSEDPADPCKTVRILTIMLASEY